MDLLWNLTSLVAVIVGLALVGWVLSKAMSWNERMNREAREKAEREGRR